MQKTAVIFGVTGQDGAFLSRLLLGHNYKVFGVARRSSCDNRTRLREFNILSHQDFVLVDGDITDYRSVHAVLKTASDYNLKCNQHILPVEIYNLAAMSDVGISFNQPEVCFDVNTKGVLNILQEMSLHPKLFKLYQAGTSEQFGSSVDEDGFQRETTPFHPRSPYAVSKVAAHHLVQNYREAYKLHASVGILFNHESELRGENFLTRKVSKYIGQLYRNIKDPKNGHLKKLELGNINSSRDWGYSSDYCIDYDIPILTNEGWKFRKDLNIGDNIINLNIKTNSIEIDTINEIYDTKSNGDRYHFKGIGIDFYCTENHRIYYQKKSVNSQGGWSDWKVATAQEIFNIFNNLHVRTKYHFRFPTFKNNNLKEFDISDDKIYLLGCLLAEGCLKKASKGRGAIVSLSQSYIANERIHKKITDILNKLGLSFSIRNRNDGVTEWIFDANSSKEILTWFDIPNVHICPKYVYSLSQRQAKILFESLMDCDGCWGSSVYISKRYLLATDFQTIAHLAGFRTGKISCRETGCYTVHVLSERKQYSYVKEIKILKNKSEDVWCINTNNGTIITRSNDSIFISGNCHGMYLMLQQDKPDDYVLASGETHTVKEFLDQAFKNIDINDWTPYVDFLPSLIRPSEVDYLRGDSSKARDKLRWQPKVNFEQLVRKMVQYDAKS